MKIKLKPRFFLGSRKRRVLSSFLVLVVLFSASAFIYVKLAFGAVVTWNGAGTTGTCGAGHENDWSCGANWSTGSAPTSSDIATFNGTSTKDATVDATFAGSVAGVNIASGYTGIITQSRSLTVGSSNFVQAAGTWNGGSQTFDVNGSFTVSGGVHNATTGTWTVLLNFTYSGGTLTMTGATVTFDDNTIFQASTLACSGGGGTLGGTVGVNKINGNDFTLSAGCNATFGSVTNAGGSVVFNGSATGTSMTIARSLTIGGAGSLSLSGSLTFNDANGFDDSTVTCTGTLSPTVTVSKSNGGDFTLAAGCNATFGSFSDLAGAITFNGAATGTSMTISRNLTVGAAGSLSLTGALTFNDANGFDDTTITCTGTLSPTVAVNKTNGGDLTLAAGCNAAFGSFTDVAGAVTFNGAATGTDMTISRSLTIGAAGSLSLSGTLTFNDANSFDNTTLTCTGSFLNGNLVTNKDNGAHFIIGSSCTLPGNFTRTAGAVDNPGSAYTLTILGNFSMSAADAFGGANLTLNMAPTTGTKTITQSAGTMSGIFKVTTSGSAIAQLATNFTTGTTCNVVEGAFDIHGHTFTCGSTFTVEDGGIWQLYGDETSTTPTLNSGSTVKYTGNGDSSVTAYTLKDLPYYSLTIASTDATDTYATPNTTENTDGNFTLTGGVFTAPSSTFTIAGNFAHTGGTFTNNSGLVNLNSASSQTITGSTTFYDFTSTGGSSKTLTFPAGGTQTISHALTLTGTSLGSKLFLRSSNAGYQWNIADNGTQSVTWVNVKDSNACSGTTIVPTGSSSMGNNSCWTISPSGGAVFMNRGINIRRGTRIKGN